MVDGGGTRGLDLHVKTPKVYFTDVGTLCHLAGLSDAAHAASGPLGGAIMETAVLSEIVKSSTHRGLAPKVSFWGTRAGTEVDIVVESDGKLVPIEVKLVFDSRKIKRVVSQWVIGHRKSLGTTCQCSTRFKTAVLRDSGQRPQRSPHVLCQVDNLVH